MKRRAAVGCASLFVVLAACGDNAVTTFDGYHDHLDAAAPPGEAGLIPGLGVGAPCNPEHTCRGGLACTNGACAPGHSAADGTPCVISAECKNGDYCGPARTCAPGGIGTDGGACKSDADCVSGLRCDLVGFSAQCKAEGTGDVGGMCVTSGDCFGGLTCAAKTCTPLSPSPSGFVPPAVSTWQGVNCVDDGAPTKAYFHVPRGSGDGDFFRLPFPNDVRVKAGHPDLTGHPSPGAELLGYDVVDRYLRDVEANTDGFSTYPTVTMRFNAPVNFDSLKLANAVRFVDITPAGAGNDLGFSWVVTTGRNHYVCANALSVRPPLGTPLKPGGTYAVLVSSAVTDNAAVPVARDADLTALLAASPPSDPALTAAYAAYAPLRTWATAKGVATSSIINAAVFTVGHPTKTPALLPAAVTAAPAPTATGWINCGSAPSPCAQATGDRACGTADPLFDELHALVTLPIFQRGTAPYSAPADGGDFELLANGTPKLQRSEQVCLSLTVPKGTAMPAAGWPVVIYAHGTGGSFRSQVSEGVAARLASVDDGAGGFVHMAVLGIDQVAHGTRRGSATASPNDLFFNFGNPLAARGNPLQGAADQLSLIRFAKALDLLAASSPTNARIKFNGISFWGHSQGATEGGIALPYASGVIGAVLSGEGAGLIDALLGKRRPVDIADALPFVLEEPTVGAYHPVLSILQNALDVADPLNHARALALAPTVAGNAKHVFQPYGIGDTFAPPASEAGFAIVAGLGLAAPPGPVTMPDSIGGLVGAPVPASANLTDGARPITAFVREYAASSYDAHFVSFRDSVARTDVDHFLADSLNNKVPRIGR
jgi:hypothetical protein